MKMNEYQYHAMQTAKHPSVEHMGFGLLEEAGEVAGILKRVFRKDPEYFISDKDEPTGLYAYYAPVSTSARYKLIKELGDVLWYTAGLASHLDISLEYIADQNLKKLQGRAAAGIIQGSGDDR